MGLLENQPHHMLEERRQLHELAANESWFTPAGWVYVDDGNLGLNFRISMGTVEFDGVLVYPPLFPDTPAYIRPQTKGERWSHHQYGGLGVFCLEHGPDNWHASVTGVDLVRSLHRLLFDELVGVILQEPPNTPSRHKQNLGQTLRFKTNRFVVTPDLLRLTGQMADGTQMPIQVSIGWLDSVAVAVVTRFGEGENACPRDVPAEITEEHVQREGWIVCDRRLADMPTITSFEALQTYLLSIDCWPWAEVLDGARKVLLLSAPHSRPRMFTVRGGTEASVWEYTAVEFDDQAQRLPMQAGDLADKWVAVVGLGSVGSKIAMSLARSGVRKFLLLDDDILGPENLVRHQLTWRSVGFHKVEAIARELKLISPGMTVIPKSFRLAGQENPKSAAELVSSLSLCSLVVDATANPDVFVNLAAICKRHSIAMVWGELFPGGGGGLMARSRPQKDANALSVRNHINGCLETLPPAPDKRATDYDRMDDQEVIIAGDAEVSALAASMTQFTLDALCDGERSQFPTAAYLLGYKKYWVFKQPFETIPIDCSSALMAEEPAGVPSAEDQAAVADFAAAIQNETHVANNTPG